VRTLLLPRTLLCGFASNSGVCHGTEWKDITAGSADRLKSSAKSKRHYAGWDSGARCIGADPVPRSAAASEGAANPGQAAEVGSSPSINFSIERMQRAGIVMMPLACAFWGLARSPTLWQMTLRSASSLKSHPTVAHSIARVCGSADKYCQDGSGWALSSQRMMTRGQSWRISVSQAYDSGCRIITDYRPACCDSAATPLRQVPTARPYRCPT